jgi:hypothetical protein
MARYLLRELPKTALRLAVAVVLFGAATQIQWPGVIGHWIGLVAGAAFAASVLIICGALLYNTLFYERYWRQVDTR